MVFKKKNELNSLKLIDFGFAEFSNKDEYLLKQCGSPGYFAPEILLKHSYNEKCDIFSAGIVLYILITGDFPFKAETGK